MVRPYLRKTKQNRKQKTTRKTKIRMGTGKGEWNCPEDLSRIRLAENSEGQ